MKGHHNPKETQNNAGKENICAERLSSDGKQQGSNEDRKTGKWIRISRGDFGRESMVEEEMEVGMKRKGMMPCVSG